MKDPIYESYLNKKLVEFKRGNIKYPTDRFLSLLKKFKNATPADFLKWYGEKSAKLDEIFNVTKVVVDSSKFRTDVDGYIVFQCRVEYSDAEGEEIDNWFDLIVEENVDDISVNQTSH